MKLSDWIKENKLSYSQAANKFGIININPATNVQRYAKGERIPHPKVMFKIFKATNKQVQPNDFYEEYWQRDLFIIWPLKHSSFMICCKMMKILSLG